MISIRRCSLPKCAIDPGKISWRRISHRFMTLCCICRCEFINCVFQVYAIRILLKYTTTWDSHFGKGELSESVASYRKVLVFKPIADLH